MDRLIVVLVCTLIGGAKTGKGSLKLNPAAYGLLLSGPSRTEAVGPSPTPFGCLSSWKSVVSFRPSSGWL